MSEIAVGGHQENIAALITRLFVSTDRRDWAVVRGCFDDPVLFDMTSVAGGAPATLTPEQITRGWDAGLQPIEQVHHQIGNVTIDVGRAGAKATATCYGIAYHYRNTKSGRNTRVFVGTYDFELREVNPVDWRICAFRFNLKFIDGNRTLESEPGA